MNQALDKQVMEGETLTIEDVKQFIADSKKKREDYLNCADRSWREIEKRNKGGKLYGGADLDRRRQWTRFPLWWSCWKIRQPITFARLPIPVLKDTQGDDPYGRTACVLGERLTRGILKTFEPFPEFASCVDDFLVTNFAWGRACYRRSECYEDEKVRLQVIQPPPPMEPETGEGEPEMAPEGEAGEQPLPPPPPIFLTPDGEQITDESQIQSDEFGPYILTGQQVTVDNEEVYFEAQLYANYYADPDARRSTKRMREAYEYHYSYREFVEKFGKAALDKLSQGDLQAHRTGQPIIVFEYWDRFLKEVRWFAENSEDFFQPVEMADIKALKEIDGKEVEVDDHSDLYGLSGFFPSTDPLVINQGTSGFWPTPEYFQMSDLLDDIHSIVGRMVLLTKAIRVRFLFDSSVQQLSQLIGETGEGGGLGIPNLEQSLMNGKGTLSNLVAYFPVDEMIQGLTNMYTALQQRFDMFYQATGISDLIRGQTNPDSDKTFGERQMEGKFALNRIEPYQRKVQEWIKDNYQLLMEMALKMFSDKSIDEYITPQTLDPEDKQRYTQALELLKNNKRRRFRVDFETDSTVAINENYKRQQATDLANTLTKAMESVANVAETQPELAGTELAVLKHLIGEFSDGKLFVDEIQDSIQQVIDKVSQPKEPDFDKDAAANDINKERLVFDQQRAVYQDQLATQKTGAESQFKQLELQTNAQIQFAQIQQKAQADSVAAQLKQLQIQIDSGASQAEMQLAVSKLQAEIAQGWEDLNIRKETLLANVQAVVGKTEMERMRLILDSRVKAQEMTLAEAEQALRAFEVQIFAQDAHASLEERIATERRLQEEHEVDVGMRHIDAAANLMDAMKPEPPKPAPISLDMSKTFHVKSPEKKGKKEPKK